MEKTIYCKKVVYKNNANQHRVLLGVIVGEDSRYIKVKTGRGLNHIISQSVIVEIVDTKQEFVNLKSEDAKNGVN